MPESELHVLGDVAGKDILEFGCGAAQWSIALAQLGARPVGLTVEDLIEPRPAVDATSSYRDAEALAWSRRWPAESIWRLRKG